MNPALEILVLGIAQDGGHPQAGCLRPCCTGGVHHHGCSLAVLDHEARRWWLIDASPDLPAQLRRVHALGFPMLPAGILLTHAHIGHYVGLMHLGREVMNADAVPVYALPQMSRFLRDHGPWQQLVTLRNIALHEATPDRALTLGPLSATPRLVPHRGEYSETAAWELAGPARAALYLPDLDRWGPETARIEAQIPDLAAIYLDGTFFSGGELPGRDPAEVPHPTIQASMCHLEHAAEKIRFIHLNHSNPALDRDSPAAAEVGRRGFALAAEAERFGL